MCCPCEGTIRCVCKQQTAKFIAYTIIMRIEAQVRCFTVSVVRRRFTRNYVLLPNR